MQFLTGYFHKNELMDSSVEVSVIIPSYNGAGKIPFLLESLLKQSIDSFEVIVVIDGSDDNTQEVLKPYEQRFTHLRIVSQNNQGRSVTRNNGAKISSGNLLIFYDDDIIAPTGAIKRHIDFHNHNYGLLCGDLIEISGNGRSDIQNYKAWLTAKWTGKYGDGISRMSQDQLFFTAANCSIRRNLFSQLNGFNPDLTDAEDYDIASRALESGLSVFYDKGNYVVHNDEISCMSYIRRLREYSAAQKKLPVNYASGVPEKDRFRILKKIIYKGFAFRFWVRLIDAGVIASVLPRGIRYKMYSTIIQALAYEHEEVRL